LSRSLDRKKKGGLMKRLTVLVFSVFMISVQSSVALEISPPSMFAEAGKVVEVIDRDTIDVDIAGKVERLRLVGMNTPTLGRGRYNPIYPGSP
jgi:endonuclease YncB( thermonuclease family)